MRILFNDVERCGFMWSFFDALKEVFSIFKQTFTALFNIFKKDDKAEKINIDFKDKNNIKKLIILILVIILLVALILFTFFSPLIFSYFI